MSKQDPKNEIIIWGMAGGFLECVYVFLIVLLLNSLTVVSQKTGTPFEGGIFMLLLFVMSALISGVLVLGKPIVLVLNKKISQAISVFFISLVTMFIIFVIVSIIIFA